MRLSVFPSETVDRLQGVQWEDTLEIETPAELREGIHWKREDRYAPLGYGGINGSKLRQLIHLTSRYIAAGGRAGILTGASVLSPQVSMAALVGRHYGLPVTIVLGGTRPETAIRSENVAIAAAAGAEFVFAPVGYNPALQKKVADLHATDQYRDHFRLCYGITTADPADPVEVEAFHAVGARQTRNIPAEVETLVMTAGSCNSCVSVLYGLALNPPPNLHRVVLLGVGPTRLEWIERRLGQIEEATGLPLRDRYRRIYHHHLDLESDHQTDGPVLLEHYDLHSTRFATYQDRMPFQLAGIDFHPTYEGKALAYMHQRRSEFDWFHAADGTVLFWIVGSAPSRAAMSPAFLLDGMTR